MTDPVLGVLGAGGISRFHFDAFAETDTRVKTICEINRESAQPFCERLGAGWTDDWQEVVADPEITAVVVLLPTSMHYEVCSAAIDAGKHVVCEKTLTLEHAQSLELGRRAEGKGLCLYTNYMKRFYPASIKARELIAGLGHIMSAHCRVFHPIGTDVHTGPAPEVFVPGPDGESTLKRLYGGGSLTCSGSHGLDLFLYLLGKPERVFSRFFTRPDHDVEFMAHALFDMPTGGVAHFESNWHPYKSIGFEKRGYDEFIEVSGVNGRVTLRTPIWKAPEHNAPILQYFDGATGTLTDYTFDVVCPYGAAERHFIDQIRNTDQGDFQDRYTGYRVDYILAKAAESARTGQLMELNWEA